MKQPCIPACQRLCTPAAGCHTNHAHPMRMSAFKVLGIIVPHTNTKRFHVFRWSMKEISKNLCSNGGFCTIIEPYK